MQVEMSSEESRLLQNALDHYLLELSGEISNTDNIDFRQDLKHEKEVLSVLVKKMSEEK